MRKILIVEDDDIIYGELVQLLSSNGYVTLDGRLDENIGKDFDLALLDVMLPDKSGYDICSIIRRTKTCPVIFLTSLDRPENEVMGFAVGGDDFVRKPFNPAVLLARIARLLKAPERVVTLRGLTLDTVKMEAICDGRAVLLTRTEFALLKVLAEGGGVMSQKEIIERLWDSEAFIDENTLYVNMSRLREKLKAIGREGAIVTVRGAGYRLE